MRKEALVSDMQPIPAFRHYGIPSHTNSPLGGSHASSDDTSSLVEAPSITTGVIMTTGLAGSHINNGRATCSQFVINGAISRGRQLLSSLPGLSHFSESKRSDLERDGRKC